MLFDRTLNQLRVRWSRYQCSPASLRATHMLLTSRQGSDSLWQWGHTEASARMAVLQNGHSLVGIAEDPEDDGGPVCAKPTAEGVATKAMMRPMTPRKNPRANPAPGEPPFCFQIDCVIRPKTRPIPSQRRRNTPKKPA